MKNRHRGFTLTEVLLVSAMFAVISLAVFNAFSNGFKLWARGQHVMVEGNTAIFLDRLAEDLRQTIIISGIPFKGDSTELKFPAIIIAPTDDNGSGRGHGFYIGEKLIGQLLSNQKIDVVFLRQARCRPQGRVRRHAGIFLEHLYRNPADFVSQHLERKIRSHVLLFAQNGERAGRRADDAEANAFGGSGCTRAGRYGRQGEDT